MRFMFSNIRFQNPTFLPLNSFIKLRKGFYKIYDLELNGTNLVNFHWKLRKKIYKMNSRTQTYEFKGTAAGLFVRVFLGKEGMNPCILGWILF